MPDCIFCQIVAGDAPSYVVAQDEPTVAFLDIGQAAPGHTLVVPRRHVVDVWDISEDDVAAAMVMATRVAHLLDERLAPDGMNLSQSNRSGGVAGRAPPPSPRDPTMGWRRPGATVAAEPSVR